VEENYEKQSEQSNIMQLLSFKGQPEENLRVSMNARTKQPILSKNPGEENYL
jgi:hypothetical protein